MTTIAYKNGVFAFDSRITKDSTICNDKAMKHLRRRGVHFFMAGSVGEFQELIRLYFAKRSKQSEIEHCEAIVYDKGKLFTIGYEKDVKYWINPEESDCPFAIGSGEDHALTAMDMGATAKEAVEFAAKRDSKTGGLIRAFDPKKNKYV